MKLLTKALEKRFNTIGKQEESDDPIVIAKYFHPCGSMTWFATEYDPENCIFFGYVHGTDFPEWGYFSLNEMEQVKLPFGLGIERDLHFREQRFSELGLS